MAEDEEPAMRDLEQQILAASDYPAEALARYDKMREERAKAIYEDFMNGLCDERGRPRG